jgi:hypothetical protein
MLSSIQMKIDTVMASRIAAHPKVAALSRRWLAQCFRQIEGEASASVMKWLEAHETLSDVEGDAEVIMDELEGVVVFRKHIVLRFEFFDRPGSVLRLMPRKPTFPVHPHTVEI